MIRSRTFHWLNLLLQVALAGIAAGLVVLLATRPGLKVLLDWSPQQRFSVSRATVELLERLAADPDRHVEFHTFYSPVGGRAQSAEAQHLQRIQLRVQELTTDLLRRYDYYLGDSGEVRHHDVRRPGTRDIVQELGVQGRTGVVVVKIGERRKVLSVLGDLAVIPPPPDTQAAPGSRQALPRLESYKGEEALSSALKTLLVTGTPKVYFLSGLREASLEQGTAMSYSEMVGALSGEGFEIRRWNVESEGRLPPDAAVIALVEPEAEISQRSAELLEEFVRGGGRLLINVAYVDQPEDYNVTLRELGKRLGFAVGTELVCHPIRDPDNPQRMLGGRPEVQNHVVQLSPLLEPTRPLAQAGRVARIKAAREVRSLGDAAPAGVRHDGSLLETGPYAWLEERDPVTRSVDYVQPEDRAAYGRRSIGAIVDVDPAEGAEREGRVVVIGGIAFNNLLWQFNGDLALNLFQWLAERKALVSVRGERYTPRTLEVTPQQLDRVSWLLLAMIPGGLLLTGLVVFWRRSRP